MFLGRGMKKASTLEPLSNDFFWPLRLQTFLLFFIFDVIRAVIQKSVYVKMTHKRLKYWSGQRDSNSQPSAWEADTLPLSYARNMKKGLLRGKPFLSSWSGRRDLNPRLQPWQGCTLPLSYSRMEATSRFELEIKVLQTYALPLGYVATKFVLERETGFEPATSTLARLHSTTELLPRGVKGFIGDSA